MFSDILDIHQSFKGHFLNWSNSALVSWHCTCSVCFHVDMVFDKAKNLHPSWLESLVRYELEWCSHLNLYALSIYCYQGTMWRVKWSNCFDSPSRSPAREICSGVHAPLEYCLLVYSQNAGKSSLCTWQNIWAATCLWVSPVKYDIGKQWLREGRCALVSCSWRCQVSKTGQFLVLYRSAVIMIESKPEKPYSSLPSLQGHLLR